MGVQWSRWVVSLTLSCCVWLAACSSPDPVPDIAEFSGATMGTWYSVKISDFPANLEPELVADVIEAELENVNALMSTYQVDSEVSRFNRAEPNAAFEVSPATFDVVGKGLDVWRRSRGAFDMTVGPLVDLWGFGPEASRDERPAEDELKAAWARVGSDAIKLDLDHHAITKTKPVALDLSAIAKGYAVDLVAKALEAQGIHRYLVEVGGEVRAGQAKQPGHPWRIAVEEPLSSLERQVHTVAELDNRALATSGDYRNFFEQDGRRYSHTIDPRTGEPVNHRLVSVSVAHRECALADAWATALMVLGPEQGMVVASEQGLAVYMIVKTDSGFESLVSPGFERILVKH